MITVINKHHRFNVMRGSPLGNIFIIGKDGTRDEVIAKYKIYLLDKIKSKDKVICDELNRIFKVAKNYDVFLECCCKGFAENCHADFIKELIESKL